MQSAIDDLYSHVEQIKKLCNELPMINRDLMCDVRELKFEADPITDIMSLVFARQVSVSSYLYADGIKSMYTVELVAMKDRIISQYHRVAERSEIPEQLKEQFHQWLHHKQEMRIRLKGKKWGDKTEESMVSTLKIEYRKPLKKLYQLLHELYTIKKNSHIKLLYEEPMVFDEKLLQSRTDKGFKAIFDEFVKSSENGK